MTKLQFLLSLHQKLSALPQDEVEERLTFYSEMIEDRMEEGLNEEEAVAAIGTVDEISAQITAQFPPAPAAVNTKKHLPVWQIVLLAVGSPLWICLLAAAFAVVLSLYAALWVILISGWAIFVSLAACALCGIIAGSIFVLTDNAASGIALMGAAAVCAGLSICFFLSCKAATVGTVMLTKNTALCIRNRFGRKEATP